MITKFIPPYEQEKLSKDKLIEEIARLESRIKQLELGLEAATSSMESTLYVKPKNTTT